MFLILPFFLIFRLAVAGPTAIPCANTLFNVVNDANGYYITGCNDLGSLSFSSNSNTNVHIDSSTLTSQIIYFFGTLVNINLTMTDCTFSSTSRNFMFMASLNNVVVHLSGGTYSAIGSAATMTNFEYNGCTNGGGPVKIFLHNLVMTATKTNTGKYRNIDFFNSPFAPGSGVWMDSVTLTATTGGTIQGENIVFRGNSVSLAAMDQFSLHANNTNLVGPNVFANIFVDDASLGYLTWTNSWFVFNGGTLSAALGHNMILRGAWTGNSLNFQSVTWTPRVSFPFVSLYPGEGAVFNSNTWYAVDSIFYGQYSFRGTSSTNDELTFINTQLAQLKYDDQISTAIITGGKVEFIGGSITKGVEFLSQMVNHNVSFDSVTFSVDALYPAQTYNVKMDNQPWRGSLLQFVRCTLSGARDNIWLHGTSPGDPNRFHIIDSTLTATEAAGSATNVYITGGFVAGAEVIISGSTLAATGSVNAFNVRWATVTAASTSFRFNKTAMTATGNTGGAPRCLLNEGTYTTGTYSSQTEFVLDGVTCTTNGGTSAGMSTGALDFGGTFTNVNIYIMGGTSVQHLGDDASYSVYFGENLVNVNFLAESSTFNGPFYFGTYTYNNMNVTFSSATVQWSGDNSGKALFHFASATFTTAFYFTIAYSTLQITNTHASVSDAAVFFFESCTHSVPLLMDVLSSQLSASVTVGAAGSCRILDLTGSPLPSGSLIYFLGGTMACRTVGGPTHVAMLDSLTASSMVVQDLSRISLFSSGTSVATFVAVVATKIITGGNFSTTNSHLFLETGGNAYLWYQSDATTTTGAVSSAWIGFSFSTLHCFGVGLLQNPLYFRGDATSHLDISTSDFYGVSERTIASGWIPLFTCYLRCNRFNGERANGFEPFGNVCDFGSTTVFDVVPSCFTYSKSRSITLTPPETSSKTLLKTESETASDSLSNTTLIAVSQTFHDFIVMNTRKSQLCPLSPTSNVFSPLLFADCCAAELANFSTMAYQCEAQYHRCIHPTPTCSSAAKCLRDLVSCLVTASTMDISEQAKLRCSWPAVMTAVAMEATGIKGNNLNSTLKAACYSEVTTRMNNGSLACGLPSAEVLQSVCHQNFGKVTGEGSNIVSLRKQAMPNANRKTPVASVTSLWGNISTCNGGNGTCVSDTGCRCQSGEYTLTLDLYHPIKQYVPEVSCFAYPMTVGFCYKASTALRGNLIPHNRKQNDEFDTEGDVTSFHIAVVSPDSSGGRRCLQPNPRSNRCECPVDDIPRTFEVPLPVSNAPVLGELTFCASNKTAFFILHEETGACDNPMFVDDDEFFKEKESLGNSLNRPCACFPNSPVKSIRLLYANRTTKEILPGLFVACVAPLPGAARTETVLANQPGSTSIAIGSGVVGGPGAALVQAAALLLLMSCATDEAEELGGRGALVPWVWGDSASAEVGSLLLLSILVTCCHVLIAFSVTTYIRRRDFSTWHHA